MGGASLISEDEGEVMKARMESSEYQDEGLPRVREGDWDYER